jgi:hypothetical protein
VEDGDQEWPDTDEPAAGEGPAGHAGAPALIAASISRRDMDDTMGGPDTDIEIDTGATRLGVGVRRPPPGNGSRHVPEMSHLAEEEEDSASVNGDAEMGDADGERTAMRLLDARAAREASASPAAQVLSEDEGEFLAAVDAMDVVDPRAGSSAIGIGSGSEEEVHAMDATLAGKRKR